jgi:hypothetical protein
MTERPTLTTTAGAPVADKQGVRWPIHRARPTPRRRRRTRRARPVPGVAQAAIQEGRYVGRLIARQLKGREPEHPFRYFDKGAMAVVGNGAHPPFQQSKKVQLNQVQRSEPLQCPGRPACNRPRRSRP